MSPSEALELIQRAVHQKRFVHAPHCRTRMQERDVSFHDLRAGVLRADVIETYVDPSRSLPPGVTCWRVFATDFEGQALTLGVDLVLDHLGPHATIVTVF